ncbi:MAG TPA: SDR family oxidoreductase [Rhizomicrobium sp.]|nr:SDR family oxidoreductase [Rhizomicrobium sp.]
MQGKTVVITGATSGIGEVAAIRLSQKGARIVLVARDKARADATLKKLSGSGHTVRFADLSRLSGMKRLAQELAAEPQIDVLMNNAGALFNRREVTEDGLEKTFATNHMSYFVVTNMLLAKLKPGARIVSTASDAHKGAKLNFDDLQSEKGYSGFAVYGKSKLCNILFNRELARRIQGTGVTANCLHPGFVATRFGDQSGGIVSVAVRVAKPLGAISPERGAQTMIYLASSPDVANVSGKYFYKCEIATPASEAQDDAAARRLWEESVKLSGVG